MDRRRYPTLLAGVAALCLVLATPAARAEMIVSEEPGTKEDSGEVKPACMPPWRCGTVPTGEGTTTDVDTPPCKNPDGVTGPDGGPWIWCTRPPQTGDNQPVINPPPSQEGVVIYCTTPPPGGGGGEVAQQVPEPSSLVLVGLGSLGLLCWRRRQKGMSSGSSAA